MDRELVEKGTLLEACLDSDRSLQQHLVYTGLAGGGRHLAHLEAAVCFTVSAKHRVKKMAGPMEVRIPSVCRCTDIYRSGRYGGTSHETRLLSPNTFSRANFATNFFCLALPFPRRFAFSGRGRRACVRSRRVPRHERALAGRLLLQSDQNRPGGLY